MQCNFHLLSPDLIASGVLVEEIQRVGEVLFASIEFLG